MEEEVATREEDPGEFFVVVGHHGRTRSLLGQRKEVVDVLDGPEGLLPQVELGCSIKLGKAGVEMALEGVRVCEIDRMRLMCVFCDVGKMETESFAQTAEFDFTDVLEAELECLKSDLLQRASDTRSACGDCEYT